MASSVRTVSKKIPLTIEEYAARVVASAPRLTRGQIGAIKALISKG